MPALDKLTIEVVADTSKATKNIAKLAQTLKNLSEGSSGTAGAAESITKAADAVAKFCDAANSTNGVATKIKKVGAALNELQNSVSGLQDTAKGIDAVAGALNRLADASDKVTGVKQTIKEIRAVGIGVARTAVAKDAVDTGKTSLEQSPITQADVDGLAAEKINEATYAVYTWKDAWRDAGEYARESLSAVLDKISAVGTTLSTVRSNAKEFLTPLWSGLKKVSVAAYGAGKKLLGMGWERLKSSIASLTGVVGNLVHSFARIAMYRALRTAIKAITTGFTDGIKHLYEWSRAVDTTFKNSMDSLSTSAHYLKDSLGAMASPLIDALAPAIEFLVDKFVSLLNVVNQFISTLTGKDTWRKAVRTPTKYSTGLEDAADSANKATKAQKKLNKALQDFDELNLITTSTTQGRNPSSKSGKGAEDYSTHFEKAPVADWIKEIKNAIKKGDWNGAGKLLATKLNGMLDKWKAKEFGEKIGQKFQNGIDFYLGFMKNFDWAKLGIKAGDFINGVLSKIKPKALGEAMVAKVKAALKFLSNFSWTVNLKPLGEAFGHAFNELFSADTMNDLGHTISGLINDAIDVGVGFVTTADFGTAAENVMDSLFTAISEINWKEAAKVVAKLATGLLDAIKSALEYAVTHIDVVLQAVWDFVGTLLGELWEYLIGSIGGLLKEFWQYVKENFWESGKDDGNGRKDGPVNSSTTGLGAGTEPTTSSYTEKVKVLYESNAQKIKDEITMFNKMNAKPKVTMTTKNFTATENSIKKITKGKTVMIYAKKDKDSFNAVTKALNKITIDRTATIKFKPVIEVSDKSTGGLSKTIASEAQLKKLLDLRAEGGFPAQGSMFVAGEVPGQAEMVGTINGKTGVASGKEITGIADAVRDTGQTEAELLREQNRLLRQILTKSGTVTLTPSAAAGRWVSQSQAAYARATGG